MSEMNAIRLENGVLLWHCHDCGYEDHDKEHVAAHCAACERGAQAAHWAETHRWVYGQGWVEVTKGEPS
jgi:hypothetical protein